MYVESPKDKDHERLKCGEGAKNCRAVGINSNTKDGVDYHPQFAQVHSIMIDKIIAIIQDVL